MKQITFLPEDFKTLDTRTDRFRDHFNDNKDCPMARALRRKFPKEAIYVYTFQVVINNQRCPFNQIFDEGDAAKMAKRVEKNGKATFRFGNDILAKYKA